MSLPLVWALFVLLSRRQHGPESSRRLFVGVVKFQVAALVFYVSPPGNTECLWALGVECRWCPLSWFLSTLLVLLGFTCKVGVEDFGEAVYRDCQSIQSS